MIDPKTDISKMVIPVSLSFEGWQTVGAGLEELSVKRAMPIIGNINAQINAFLNPPAPTPAPAPAPVVLAEAPAESPAAALAAVSE